MRLELASGSLCLSLIFSAACGGGTIDSFSGPPRNSAGFGAGGSGGLAATGGSSSSASTGGSGSTSSGGSGSTSGSSGAAGMAGTTPLPPCEPTTQSIHDTIIAPSCTERVCHGGGFPAAGLDLSGTDWAAALVSVSSSTCDGWARIVPGDPASSFLYEKVTKDKPACDGDRMPGGMVLPDQYIQCISDWITSLGQGGCETCGGSTCVSLPTDPLHCGQCGTACPADATCQSGSCACPGGKQACGASCVDTTSDALHCGACDTTCPSGATCEAGQCTCSGSLSACGSTCVDLKSDGAHCGACAAACQSGEVCLDGACTSGCGKLTACGASCVDLQTSATSCGTCGTACAAGFRCVAGACSCGAGLEQCGSSCVDLTSDEQNCGACGTACGPGSTCTSGTCQCGSTTISFANDVQPIFTGACTNAGCHAGTRPKEGLSLEASKSYDALVGVASSQCGKARLRVAAGSSGQSYLVSKLLGTDLCSGSQMPKAGTSLPAADLTTISDWICQGAKRN
ncbi:MAG TPA: MXAN_6577-like cysteine-rich protein [Polyangiaceae bacterium]|nr:MXAN_6577-like cysteine-rich protein [Polyangiaceae bacterium]